MPGALTCAAWHGGGTAQLFAIVEPPTWQGTPQRVLEPAVGTEGARDIGTLERGVRGQGAVGRGLRSPV